MKGVFTQYSLIIACTFITCGQLDRHDQPPDEDVLDDVADKHVVEENDDIFWFAFLIGGVGIVIIIISVFLCLACACGVDVCLFCRKCCQCCADSGEEDELLSQDEDIESSYNSVDDYQPEQAYYNPEYDRHSSANSNDNHQRKRRRKKKYRNLSNNSNKPSLRASTECNCYSRQDKHGFNGRRKCSCNRPPCESTKVFKRCNNCTKSYNPSYCYKCYKRERSRSRKQHTPTVKRSRRHGYKRLSDTSDYEPCGSHQPSTRCYEYKHLMHPYHELKRCNACGCHNNNNNSAAPLADSYQLYCSCEMCTKWLETPSGKIVCPCAKNSGKDQLNNNARVQSGHTGRDLQYDRIHPENRDEEPEGRCCLSYLCCCLPCCCPCAFY